LKAAECINTRFWGTLNSGAFYVPFQQRHSTLSSIRSDLYWRIIELMIQARKDAGITQAELGQRIGQRQTFISKVELGERRIDVAEFVELCAALEIDYAVLLRDAVKE
jgi:ribosome-binding protein aMBF1 (putative translation factor)